jgi:copper transport outer membrane protein MctB
LFTFRYHAISLIAVFLALGIGVLLGVSIGEEGVVSGARKDLEQSLRGDLRDARSHASDLRGELRIRDEFERQAYPGLVADLLPGFRIGIVAIGDLPGGYPGLIRDAVEPAGADVTSISVISSPLRLRRLAQDLKGTSFSEVATNDGQVSRFADRVGKGLVNGSGLVERVRRELFSSSRGEYRGLDGVVWVRDREGLKGDRKRKLDRFESALLGGMAATDAEVVGVETRDADPSQIPFMTDNGLSSVDDLDLVAGQTALVYALLGAQGRFGVKDTAEQLLPPPPASEGRGRR